MANMFNMDLSFSTAFHPATNCGTERKNQDLKRYLRCYISNLQNNWLDLLPLPEAFHNSTFQRSICQTPDKVVYGYDLNVFAEYVSHAYGVLWGKFTIPILFKPACSFSGAKFSVRIPASGFLTTTCTTFISSFLTTCCTVLNFF